MNWRRALTRTAGDRCGGLGTVPAGTVETSPAALPGGTAAAPAGHHRPRGGPSGQGSGLAPAPARDGCLGCAAGPGGPGEYAVGCLPATWESTPDGTGLVGGAPSLSRKVRRYTKRRGSFRRYFGRSVPKAMRPGRAWARLRRLHTDCPKRLVHCEATTCEWNGALL